MEAPSSPTSEYSNYDGDGNTSYGPWASLFVGQINNQMDHDFDDAQDVETILGHDVSFGKVAPGPSASTTVEKPSLPLVNPDTLSQILRIVTQQAIALDACRTELESFRKESSQSVQEKDNKIKSLQREVKTLRKEGDRREEDLVRTKAQLSSDVGKSKVEESLKSMERRFEQSVARIEGEKAELVLQISTMRIANAQLKNRLDERGAGMDVFGGLDEDQLNAKVAEIVRGSCLDLITESETLKQNLAEASVRADRSEREAAASQEQLEETQRELEDYQGRLVETEAHLAESSNAISGLESHLSGMKEKLDESEQQRSDLQSKLNGIEEDNARLLELQETVEKLNSDAKSREEDFEKSKAELRQSIVDRENELAAIRSESDATKQRLADSEMTVTTLERDLSARKLEYEEQCASLLQKLDSANNDLKVALRQRDELQDETTQLQKTSAGDLIQLREEVARLENEKTSSLKASEELNEQLASMTSRFSDLQKQHTELLSNTREVQTSMEVKVKELDDVKSNLKRVEKERDVALMDTDQLRAVLQDSTDRIEKLSTDLDVARKSASDLDKKRLDDAEVIKSLRKDLEKSNTNLREVEADLKKEKKSSQEVSVRCEQVLKDLRGSKSTLDAVTMELAEAKKTSESLQQADVARSSLLEDLAKQVGQLKQSLSDKDFEVLQAMKDTEKYKREIAAVDKGIAADRRAATLTAEKLADVEKRNTQLEEANKGLENSLREAQLECRGAQAQLAEVQEHLSVSDRLNNELITSKNKAKTDLAKAQAHIEKLEAARTRMAAIYGLPTSQSPLPSPDRTHPIRRLSGIAHTPSASPPTAHTSLNRVSPDQGLPPNKRARLSAATWPSTLNNDITMESLPSSAASINPRPTVEKSGPGQSAATAISVDDDTSETTGQGDQGPGTSKKTSELEPVKAQEPAVSSPVTAPVTQLPPDPEVLVKPTESQKEADVPVPSEPANKTAPSPAPIKVATPKAKPPRRVLPDRQARRTSQLISSKALLVEQHNDNAYIRDLERANPVPSPKISNNEKQGKGSRKRKVSPLSQEASASDLERSLSKEDAKAEKSQGTPDSTALTQQIVEIMQSLTPTTTSPDLVEPYILQHGPPTASARALYELFARICTWSYKDSLPICALCMLEGSHEDGQPDVKIDFHALSDAVKFWRHCHEVHKAYWRPDLQNALYGPQGLVRSVTGLPTSENLSPASRDDKVREIVACFTKLSTWSTAEGEFVCGLCELENTHSDRTPFPKLQFDPYRQPDLFWGHCRTSHPLFWKPEVRNSVELVPSFLRS